MPEILWILFETLVKAVIILTAIMLSAAGLVYWERKVSAWIQNRIGPNRVGPFGVLQPFADVFKLFFKEDLIPAKSDKLFHSIAPIISLGITISVFAVIPFAHYIELFGRTIYIGIAPNAGIGILFILAMTSVGVYGLTIAGWSSNSKYSLLGGLRSSAQMISYELSMGLSVLAVIMITGTLNLNEIVLYQGSFVWNILLQPLGFLIFLVASFAETNRAPFDLPEAEPELVGGFNTEYSGMKFGMFFLAEYGNMFAAACIISLLYLGGWHEPFDFGFEPGSIPLALIQFFTFIAKIAFVCFFFIWVRWSVPRFRYDQLMNLGWKVMLPLSLLNVALTGAVILIIKYFS